MLTNHIDAREPDPRRRHRGVRNRDRHAATLMTPTVAAWEALRRAVATVLARLG